jgi:hypothetical protein
LQPLDLCCFGILKTKYRVWLSERALVSDAPVTEEQAVLKICDIFRNLSARAINHSFRLTGLEKFKNCDGEAPEDLNPDTILNELNQ